MINLANSVTTIGNSTNDASSVSKKDASNEAKSSFTDVLKSTKSIEDKTAANVKEKSESDNESKPTALNEPDNKLKDFDLNQLLAILSLFNISPKDISNIKEALLKGNDDKAKTMVLNLMQNTSIEQLKSAIELAFSKNLTSLDTNTKSEEKNISDFINNINGKINQENKVSNDFIALLKKLTVEDKSDDEASLKQAIIARLDKMLSEDTTKLNNSKSVENIIHSGSNDESLNKLFPELINKANKDSGNVGSADKQSLDENKINFIVQVPSKTSEKEDKLLKSIASEEKPKGMKDYINDKITNTLTRFEVSNMDKQTAVIDKPIISKASFNTDFIRAVKFMDINNLKELSVKLMPKELGQIVIKITMDNGIMKANITANNKEAYDLLNSQLGTISKQLSEQNLTIQSFSLSLSNGDNFLFSGNEGNQKQQQRDQQKMLGIEAVEDEEMYSEAKNQQDSNVNLLA